MTQPRTSSLPFARGSRRLCALALVSLLAASAASASAQAPAVNFGFGVGMRLENSTNYDGATGAGQSRLMLNATLDTDQPGPYLLSLEQGGAVLASGSCETNAVIYSGEEQDRLRTLRECSTSNVLNASIRTNAPVSVVLALVNDATDARTEVYRGEFPVYAYSWWDRNDGDRAIHIEHRGLRLDSFYGAAFLHQYIATEIMFTYVDSSNGGSVPRDTSFRCKVGEGEWAVYDGTLYSPFEQNSRNRVWLDGTVHEDGVETLTTRLYRFSARMPIAVQGSSSPPSAGSSMDGNWTCEMRLGSAGSRVVAREFRFTVQNGYVGRHAVEAQLPAGRASVMASIGFNPAAMPAVFDPALVRATIAGRALTGSVTAPVLSALPARAANPAFTMPRGAPAGRATPAPRGRGRGR